MRHIIPAAPPPPSVAQPGACPLLSTFDPSNQGGTSSRQHRLRHPAHNRRHVRICPLLTHQTKEAHHPGNTASPTRHPNSGMSHFCPLLSHQTKKSPPEVPEMTTFDPSQSHQPPPIRQLAGEHSRAPATPNHTNPKIKQITVQTGLPVFSGKVFRPLRNCRKTGRRHKSPFRQKPQIQWPLRSGGASRCQRKLRV